jgi:hypothetical protein
MGNTCINLTPFCEDIEQRHASVPKQAEFRHMNDCNATNPCGLLPCANCGEAFQAWFVQQCVEVFGNAANLTMVCIVAPRFIVSDDELSGGTVENAVRWVRDLIHRAGLGEQIWLGSIDISRNIGLPPRKIVQWCIHWNFITTALKKEEKKALRVLLETGKGVKVPLKCTKVHQLEGAARYSAKEIFYQRNEYCFLEGQKRIRDYPLQGAPLSQLMEDLNEMRHEQRLITIGLRRHGSTLVRTK